MLEIKDCFCLGINFLDSVTVSVFFPITLGKKT